MNETNLQDQVVQSVYGALVGGLISSFLAVAVLTVFVDPGSGDVQVWGALVGLGSAVALMAAGLMLAERTPWLGTALLFGSGFTVLWSVVLSFWVVPRWIMLVALGAAIVIAGILGIRRFGRSSGPRRLADTPVGIPEPNERVELPDEPTVRTPDVPPPSKAPEIVLPPGIHPVDGGDIRD